MTDDVTLKKLRAVFAAEQRPLSQPATKMAQAIEARHGDAVIALVFYGSALRESDDPDKMLDFYVVVKDYRSVYPNPFLRFATALLPPGVHFLQVNTDDGHRLRAKYAIVSEAGFHRRVSGGLETMLWARFVQPSLIHARSAEIRDKIIASFAMGCAHFYRQTAPLITDKSQSVWTRGLAESYRTELRPERPFARAAEIVARNKERYAALTEILSEELRSPSPMSHRLCTAKWWLRRMTGKPRGALRVLKAALTFDAGLDYLLEKVGSHSGVEIELSDAAHRHPILYSPVIAWRLYRAGAFR
ncbi:hypothetical protein [Roseovarius rhodophyticola]|uniref:Phosphatidate cytidylyltransferase n=1 Tax=Roseovarius rhodophyticola TaxID=3080827 RepID=A0ABZ2TC55_9RHOB|nr:hypothetical protein [Roseovarius sp. W115]MDV2931019.1 hypothetical protein [Roseovarius sp. W115]